MKVIFSSFLVAILFATYGQSKEIKYDLSKADYLQKSKRQKTISLITGGAGLTLFTAGLIMYMSEFGKGLPGGSGYNESTSKTGETLMYVGGGLVLVSVPFQLAYKKNKKMAASISLEKRSGGYFQEKNKLFASTVSFKIYFDRN